MLGTLARCDLCLFELNLFFKQAVLQTACEGSLAMKNDTAVNHFEGVNKESF